MDWQTPVALLLAGLCLAWMLRSWVRTLRGRGTCGPCHSCGPGSGDELLHIEDADRPSLN